ncbi:MAG: hypothetical protein JW814_01730 [Candidatus Krumholzibacteriota bacterium]|nr:hypothetical protein [Candidatus Krumholzibacteriota bacterium]
MLGERNNVVVHFKDGRVLKGFTHDFLPERPLFHLNVALEGQASDVRDIKVADLKAVFFTKTFEGNKSYKEKKSFEQRESTTYHGIKIKVDFKDGEVIRGMSLGYNKHKKGFFVIPIDPKSNNNRIYVVMDATAKVAVGPAAEQ